MANFLAEKRAKKVEFAGARVSVVLLQLSRRFILVYPNLQYAWYIYELAENVLCFFSRKINSRSKLVVTLLVDETYQVFVHRLDMVCARLRRSCCSK